jgi:hypothetical protein
MSEQFPPANYIPTDSALDGIEIYMPAPPDSDPHQKEVDFKCPQCGAATAYSAEDGGLTCSYCGYFEAPKAETIGRRAQQFEFTIETMQRAAQGWGTERKELECQNCGALTTVPVEEMSHTCPFCASNKVIQRQAPQDVLRPRFLVPFKIEPSKCVSITRNWLGSSWMTPAKLRQASSLGNFTAVYLPYWTFSANTAANWKAQVGHTKTQRYFEDGKWKTRQVTVWRWESGNTSLNISDLLVPGTSRLSNKLLEETKSFNMAELVSYEPKFLAGIQASTYNVPLEKAWDIGRTEMREQTRQACLSQTSTQKVRNFSMNMDFADESWRYVLLPAYLNTYTYENNPYQMMINAQNGSISGQRPVDWRKIWLVIALLISPGLIIGFIGLVTAIFGGIGIAIGAVGFVLLVLGVVFSFIIWQKASSLDDL